MVLNVIFLLSSIATARLLDKKKMRAASVAYSVMVIIMLAVLLFTVEAEVIRSLMVHLVGKMYYVNVHYAFMDAIRAPIYGVFIAGALLLTFVVQLAAAAFSAANVIVCHFPKKKSPFPKSKKAYIRLVHDVRSLLFAQDVNLLACRMLI